MDVEVKLTAWHGGWFEFRLCVPFDGGKDRTIAVTQDCLNQHVLKIDPTTPEYPTSAGHGKTRLDYTDISGGVRCAATGGHPDVGSSTPNTAWPGGSCCNGGGACSPPEANDDRWIVPAYSTQSYKIKLRAPAGIECERCTLQWFYQTGNSHSNYPESFCLPFCLWFFSLLLSNYPESFVCVSAFDPFRFCFWGSPSVGVGSRAGDIGLHGIIAPCRWHAGRFNAFTISVVCLPHRLPLRFAPVGTPHH